MKFQSLEEIINHFSINAKKKAEAKRALKALLKTNHPDKNGGVFENESDKQRFLEIKAGLEFLDNNLLNTSLIEPNQITELTKLIKDLSVVKKENEEKFIEKKENTLGNSIKDSIKYFRSQNYRPKLTSAILLAVITFLWLFPETVKKKPGLSFLFANQTYFTIGWLFFLLLTGITWIITKQLEKSDAEIKSTYKLESVQNRMFQVFIKSIDRRWRFERDTPLTMTFS